MDAGLEYLGDFDVHFADDGITGIEELKSHSPDLLLVDLVLPSVSGIEVLNAIRNDREINRPARVVLMTGIPDPLPGQHFRDFGIDRILPKPFKLDQLKSALFD